MPQFKPEDLTNRGLFEPSIDPGRNTRLGLSTPDWYRFAHGYKVAADLLVTRLNERGAADEHACYPILFLYRHSVELSLKALLNDVGELIDWPRRDGPEHSLMRLWQTLRERLLTYDRTQDSTWLARADALIRQLHEVDPGSLTFRYPVSNDGIPMLTGGGTMSIEAFRDRMGELASVFHAISAFVSAQLDLKRELEEEEDEGLIYYYHP